MTDFSQIRSISFDLDDTLWPCAPVIARAERRFYAWLEVHYPAIPSRYDFDTLIDHRVHHFGAHPDWHHDLTHLRKEWLRGLADEVGYDHSLVDSGFEVFWMARNEVEFFEQSEDVLDRLTGLYRLGSMTNGNADVHHIGIGHYFDFVITSAEIGQPKPHPDIYQAAIELSGVPAEQLLHVGDDPVRDIQGASALGIRTVWINMKNEPWPGGEKPDAMIQNISELPNLLGI
jgi:putative hydrolase of the HAD superfamily